MAIVNGPKIVTLVSAANGDTYGDGERHQFRTWQALIQANVKGDLLSTLIAPPGSPSNGDTYVVSSTSANGLWVGQTNAIAYWAVDAQDGPSITPNIATGAWEFYTPLAGWQVWDTASNALWRFNGTNWILASARKIAIAPVANVVTVNPALASSFRVNVNATVTSVVFSNGTADGQNIEVLWVQDVTGHPISGFAANIHGVGFLTAGSNTFVGTPSGSANAVSSQRYTWDSTASVWYALATGISGM